MIRFVLCSSIPNYILFALHPMGYSLRAARVGFLLGPLAIHLWPLSASHTCKCNIDLPWALITSPFNPQPPRERERGLNEGREKVDLPHLTVLSLFTFNFSVLHLVVSKRGWFGWLQNQLSGTRSPGELGVALRQPWRIWQLRRGRHHIDHFISIIIFWLDLRF